MMFGPYHRSRALLTALVTLSVPGALTVVAVAGHLRSAAQPTASAAAVPELSITPAAPVSRPQVVHARGPAVALLVSAADAGESVSYQGVELISRWTMGGTDTVLSSVWHASGGRTLTKTTEAASLSGGTAQLSYDPYQESPEGVFGVTKPLITLLATHYLAAKAGTGSVAGRPAVIVNVVRPGGALAARFWIDIKTSLPLRREDYDSAAHMISEAAFIEVSLGNVTVADPAPSPATVGAFQQAQIRRDVASASSVRTPAADPLTPAMLAATDWTGATVPAALLAKMRGSGSQLPAVLPGGLSLYAAAATDALDGSVVDLSYSDGLFEVSLFVQRGVLATKLDGWNMVRLGTKYVFVSSRGVTWSARGYVYTVLADAPPQTVAAAVEVLPHDTPPGFWLRLGRGLKRLARLVDPFR